MARTSLYAPAHRVMGRYATSIGPQAQSPTIGPSFDAVSIGIQDARWRYNVGGSGTAPQVLGWLDLAAYPQRDLVPPALNAAAFAAAQAVTANTPMTLVAASGNGVVVPTQTYFMPPGGTVTPVTARFVLAVPTYSQFGYGKQQSWAYDFTTQLSRCLTITSVGNDSAATMQLTGVDEYGFTIHQNITMANAGVVTTTKAFRGLLSAVPTGTLSGSNVSIGTADVFGLPFFCNMQSALEGFWNNAIHYNTGTFVAGVTTSPATALTGDPRGTWAPPNASDGTKRWTMYQRPQPSQMISAGINPGMFGVAAF